MDAEDKATISPSGVDSLGNMETLSIKSAFAVHTDSYENDTDNQRVVGTISLGKGSDLQDKLKTTPRDEYVTFVFDDKGTTHNKCPVADIPSKDLYTDTSWLTWSVDLEIKNFPPDVAAAASLCGCFNLNAGTIQDEMAASDKKLPQVNQPEPYGRSFEP